MNATALPLTCTLLLSRRMRFAIRWVCLFCYISFFLPLSLFLSFSFSLCRPLSHSLTHSLNLAISLSLSLSTPLSISHQPQQEAPFTRDERGKMFKLAFDVSEKAHRPPIRETWNPAMSLLIASCWCDDPSLRPEMGQVMSSLATIMKGDGGQITRSTPTKRAATSGQDVVSAHAEQLYLAPGELWRRIEVNMKSINLGEVLGQGSFATVHKCLFQGEVAALKMFRNTTEKSAFKEIEMLFSLRHPNVIGLYAWYLQRGTVLQVGWVVFLTAQQLKGR